MSAELAVQERSAQLVTAPRYSDDQMQLLVDTIARGCDPNEFKLFIEVAKSSRLNPFNGQIRPVKRWNSDLGREAMVVQVGIDGYRAIASRTGDLAGIDDAVFDTEDEDHPIWAKVTVYRWSHDQKVSFTATARWKEYAQKKKGGEVNSMWSGKPYLMLAKCAEALALRKAFPDELSGMYTEEEMGQADNPDPNERPPVTQPTRESEKKQAEKKSEAQPAGQPEVHAIVGVIEAAKTGREGAVWFTLDKRIVALRADLVRDTMSVGGKLSVKAIHQKPNGDRPEYYVAVEVVESTPPDRGIGGGGGAPAEASAEKQSEFVQELDSAMSEPSADSAVNLDELVGDNKVQKASDLPSGGSGKIGPKRAQRLYAMSGQNKASNNGLNEANLKKIIARLTPPLEHLGDLPMDMYPMFEKLATGETDWRGLLED